MRLAMRQRMGTTWANECEIELSTELDNPHSLTTAELCLLMVLTMETACEQVRNENERVLELGAPSEEARKEYERRAAVRDHSDSGRERERLTEMSGGTEGQRERAGRAAE